MRLYVYLAFLLFAADVWLLGDSIVYWAGVRAVARQQANLRLPDPWTIGWYGIRGMSWADFNHSLQLRILFQPPPKMIFINLGGNDMTACSMLRIFNWIHQGLDTLAAAYPDSYLVWCDILQRLHWGDTPEQNIVMESKRRRVNRFGRQQVRLHVKGEILIHDIDYQTPGFFRADGIHLSDVGLDMYLDAVRDKILSIM